MQLTKHFDLFELTVTHTGLANEPPYWMVERLRIVALGLERIRGLVGGPIRVHSGYRSEQVNRAVGGVPTSAHRLGWAADVSFPGRTLGAAVERLRAAYPRELGAFDQLIVEETRRVLHCSFDPRFRSQWLIQSGGPGTTVRPWPRLTV